MIRIFVKIRPGRLPITFSLVIVLLPPSETKRAGGDGPPLRLESLSFPALLPLRTALVDELMALAADPPACRRALGISASQHHEIERNRALRAAPTMPAIDRYTGVLYDALNIGTLSGTALSRARARLVVGSALFGLVRADDPIPAYRLSASSKLPGQPTLASRWRPVLEPVLAGWPPRSWWSTFARARMRGWVGCLPRLGPMWSASMPTATAPWSLTSTRHTRAGSRGRLSAAGPNPTTRPTWPPSRGGRVCGSSESATSSPSSSTPSDFGVITSARRRKSRRNHALASCFCSYSRAHSLRGLIDTSTSVAFARSAATFA